MINKSCEGCGYRQIGKKLQEPSRQMVSVIFCELSGNEVEDFGFDIVSECELLQEQLKDKPRCKACNCLSLEFYEEVITLKPIAVCGDMSENSCIGGLK